MSGGLDGFVAFGFRNVAENVEGRVTHTEAYDGKPSLRIRQDEHWNDRLLDAAANTVQSFLAETGVGVDELAVVVGSQPTPSFLRSLVERIGLPPERAAALDLGGKDPFTSATPLGFAKIRGEKSVAPGTLGLIVEAGSGMQVACALYQF